MNVAIIGAGDVGDIYDYTGEQMKQLLPVDKYGVQIKMKSSSGETKWMTLSPKRYEDKTEEKLDTIMKGLRVALGFEKSFNVTGTIRVQEKISADSPVEAQDIMNAKYKGQGLYIIRTEEEI